MTTRRTGLRINTNRRTVVQPTAVAGRRTDHVTVSIETMTAMWLAC